MICFSKQIFTLRKISHSLPPAVVLSPPTYWKARDQPEPGSFFPRMKDPGNEVDAVPPCDKV